MNHFGRLFTVNIFGESHGTLVGVNIDGIPAGIPINIQDFEQDLLRRQGGNQIGTTPRKEEDTPQILTGVFNNYTTGAPILINFPNNNTKSEAYNPIVDVPRPSHADWVASKKYNGFQDYRGGGHFSARLTTGIVAAGVIAKKILTHLQQKISITAKVTHIGGFDDLEQGLQHAIQQKDTIGAQVQCEITNVPVGLGEPFWDSIESVLAHAMFAIPAVKGIEFGAGFKAAQMLGIEHNDPIIDINGTTSSNNAGGIVGGISNGNNIVFNLAFKPAASTPKVQTSYNFTNGTMESFSIKGRHDLCVALRAPVIVEAMAAIVLTDFFLIHHSQQYSK